MDERDAVISARVGKDSTSFEQASRAGERTYISEVQAMMSMHVLAMPFLFLRIVQSCIACVLLYLLLLYCRVLAWWGHPTRFCMSDFCEWSTTRRGGTSVGVASVLVSPFIPTDGGARQV
jgi:hypothetical protein